MTIKKEIVKELTEKLQFAKGFTYTNAIHFNQVLRAIHEVLTHKQCFYDISNFDWGYNRARCETPSMIKGEISLFIVLL